MYVNSLKHISHCIGKARKLYGIEGDKKIDIYLAKRFISGKYTNLDEYITTELCNNWETYGTDK